MSDKRYFSLDDEIIFDNGFEWCCNMYEGEYAMRVQHMDSLLSFTSQIGYEIDIDNGDIEELKLTFSRCNIDTAKVLRTIGHVTQLIEVNETEAFKIINRNPKNLIDFIMSFKKEKMK